MFSLYNLSYRRLQDPIGDLQCTPDTACSNTSRIPGMTVKASYIESVANFKEGIKADAVVLKTIESTVSRITSMEKKTWSAAWQDSKATLQKWMKIERTFYSAWRHAGSCICACTKLCNELDFITATRTVWVEQRLVKISIPTSKDVNKVEGSNLLIFIWIPVSPQILIKIWFSGV